MNQHYYDFLKTKIQHISLLFHLIWLELLYQQLFVFQQVIAIININIYTLSVLLKYSNNDKTLINTSFGTAVQLNKYFTCSLNCCFCEISKVSQQASNVRKNISLANG